MTVNEKNVAGKAGVRRVSAALAGVESLFLKNLAEAKRRRQLARGVRPESAARFLLTVLQGMTTMDRLYPHDSQGASLSNLEHYFESIVAS